MTLSDRRLAFSYTRFSTPRQRLGDSLRRQVERTAAFCAEHDLVLDESLRDEGLSGFHGKHLGKKGALGRFIARVKAGEIARGSVLIVEGFDRLSRQTPREAQEQFLSLINQGIEIVTLIDRQWFSAASVDANAGQLFLSIGFMMGAHSESKNKSDRITQQWTQRRGTASNVVPSWIVRSGSGLTLDPAKVQVLRRIFADIQTMGLDRLARALNTEGIRTFTTRRRARSENLWDAPALYQIIRGKQVLGLQEIGHRVDGVRVTTGEFIAAYPAAVDATEWQAANAAIQARRSGPANGRNVTQYANIFGALAVCGVCGARMKIRQKGKYIYVGCSAVGLGQCRATRYHRLPAVERRLFAFLSTLAMMEAPDDDPAAALAAALVVARDAAAKLAALHAQRFGEFGDAAPGSLIALSLARIEADHAAAVGAIKSLESKLYAVQSAKPASVQLSALQALAVSIEGLQGRELVTARAQIAAALPAVLAAIKFFPDGRIMASLVPEGEPLELDPASKQRFIVAGGQSRSLAYYEDADLLFISNVHVAEA